MRRETYGDKVAEDPSVLASVGSLLRQSRGLSVDYLLLAALDARRAAARFGWLLCTGVVVAVLLVTAWLALVAGAIVWMLGTGASWLIALGVAVSINLLAAAVLARWMWGLVKEPPFAATLRQLRGGDELDREMPS